MFKRLFLELYFYFRPPKEGNVYYGSPIYFVIGRPLEYVLHGLKDNFGNVDSSPIPSFGCYKLTIEKNTLEEDFYLCKSEVLCDAEKSLSLVGWYKRSQSRKISKVLFKDFVLSGILEKGI